jgi:hypothetical protein
MPTWSDDFIQRLEVEAELEIARQTNYARDRISLAITAGTANYVLPNYVRGIIDIKWKGRKIYPLFQRENIQINPSYLTTRGTVTWYMRSPEDFQYIRFVKVPDETIAADSSDDLLDSSVMVNRVVITFFREPDVSQSILSIPDYFGRRLIRDWVLYMAFKSEGNGQDLKASAHYKQTYEYRLKRYKDLMERYYQTRESLSNIKDYYNRDMPRLERDFQITPGPYALHQGIPDSLSFSDDIEVSLL